MNKWLKTILLLVGSAILTRLIPFSYVFRTVDTMIHEFGHALVTLLTSGRVLAVDLDANGNPLKWKVENSWGTDSGQNGYFIMTNRWFNEYMFRLVVNKKYASEQLLKEAEQKPTMVMPEDPLFAVDD